MRFHRNQDEDSMGIVMRWESGSGGNWDEDSIESGKIGNWDEDSMEFRMRIP